MVIVEEEGEEDGIELKGRSCCGTANQAADGDIANSALCTVEKGGRTGDMQILTSWAIAIREAAQHSVKLSPAQKIF